MKTTVGLAAVLILLATNLVFADPQSEISAYRRSHGLSAVTIDAKLTALASKQANAMAARGVMDHGVDAPFSTRIASYGTTSAGENIAMGCCQASQSTQVRVITPRSNRCR